MRRLAIALLVLHPAWAAAQAPSTPTLTVPVQAGPTPGLAPIGLPLAPMGVGPVTETTSTPALARPAQSGPGVFWLPWMPPVIVGAPRPGVVIPVPVRFEEPVPSPPPARGVLRLVIGPRMPRQIWVDGYFVASAEDARDGISIEAGARQVELRDPDFETARFGVQVLPGRTVTYRDDLTPRVAPPPSRPTSPPTSASTPSSTPPAPSVGAARKVFYFLPGCYMGDVPPEQVVLPSHCDISKVVTSKP